MGPEGICGARGEYGAPVALALAVVNYELVRGKIDIIDSEAPEARRVAELIDTAGSSCLV